MKRKAHKRILKQARRAQKKRCDWKAFLNIARKRDILLILVIAEGLTIIFLAVWRV